MIERPIRSGILGALLLLAACDPVRLAPDDNRGVAWPLRVYEAEFVKTAHDGRPAAITRPVEGVTVAVSRDGELTEWLTDADGRAMIAMPGTEPYDLRIVDRLGRGTSVLGWPGGALSLVVPIGDPAAPTLPTELAAAVSAEVRGHVEGWTSSGIGQDNVARMAWREAAGLRFPGAPADDLVATAGIYSGSGSAVCSCSDPDDEPYCESPGSEVICIDPGDAADGVSGVSFHVPPGPIEIGLVEQIYDRDSGHLLEIAAMTWAPVESVPPEGLADRIWTPERMSDPMLCRDSRVPGALELRLHGIDRAYTLSARGAIRLEVRLVSPFGLALPFVPPTRWPAFDVYDPPETEREQVISIRYPFPLTGELDGFSWGYAVEATSISPPLDGGEIYAYRVRRALPDGEAGPCRIDVGLETFETVFSSPTTQAPLRLGAERVMHWRGTAAPLRRIDLEGPGGRTERAWIFDTRRTRLDLSDPVPALWPIVAGDWTLVYTVHEAPEGDPGSWLGHGDVLLAETQGAFFEQRHPFRVE